MNRKAYAGILVLACSTLGFLTNCSSSSHHTPPPVVTIAATSGGGQQQTVGAAFANPLVATVSTGGTPTANASVTFTSPATTDGTFANGTTTDTETTNASGVAMSTAFTAGTKAGAYNVTASTSGASTPASFGLTNNAGPAASLAISGGNNQSATVGTAFGTALVVQVSDSDGNGVQGVSVTFTANTGATGASGSFTSTSSNIETQPTDANGNATVSDLVANSTTGAFTVKASATGLTATSFSLTNRLAPANYSFYVSGNEVINPGPSGLNFYTIAGAVDIDVATGNVLGGEQDYNNGITTTAFDNITGGQLTVSSSTGQGMLTLITGDASVGVGGTETFAVQFVNTNHALITQFDGTATSSGSMDTRATSAPSGNFAYAFAGVDKTYAPKALGGVFKITGTAVAGVTDQNDSSGVKLNQPFTGTLSAQDAFGRGTLTITGSNDLISYYVVGPEVIRIIDVSTTQAYVGSAFGQGAGSFTNASLAGNSVFAILDNWDSAATAGQFSTSNTSSNPANFAGVGDDNELGNGVGALGALISGTYSIGSNGYGSLSVTSGNLGSVTTLGVYMTDPTLNLSDPNNTTSGGGGALVLYLDAILLGGAGVLVPQTDTSTASFDNNSYAVGAQNANFFTACFCEFDMVAQGSTTAGALSLTGDVSDPFFTLTAGGTGLYAGSTFTGTPQGNAGRYSMLQANTTPNPLAGTINGVAWSFDLAIYQASGGQLFWIEVDNAGVWLGPIEQMGSLTGLPAARKPAAKTQAKLKP